jgi:hypothetical protein
MSKEFSLFHLAVYKKKAINYKKHCSVFIQNLEKILKAQNNLSSLEKILRIRNVLRAEHGGAQLQSQLWGRPQEG